MRLVIFSKQSNQIPSVQRKETDKQILNKKTKSSVEEARNQWAWWGVGAIPFKRK